MNIITPPVVSTADIPSEDIVTTDDGWQYSIQDDELVICGYVGEETEITIPDVIDGYDVLNIWEYAFADNTNNNAHSVNKHFFLILSYDRCKAIKLRIKKCEYIYSHSRKARIETVPNHRHTHTKNAFRAIRIT